LNFDRVLKNKHQAVSQGVRRFGKRGPPEADEHLQKPHNAGSRPQAQFFNTMLILGGPPVKVKPPDHGIRAIR
jgi:hypothetical protein